MTGSLRTLAVAALLLLLPLLAIVRLFRERRATSARLMVHAALSGAASGAIAVGLAATNRQTLVLTAAVVIVPAGAMLGAAVAFAVRTMADVFAARRGPGAPP